MLPKGHHFFITKKKLISHHTHPLTPINNNTLEKNTDQIVHVHRHWHFFAAKEKNEITAHTNTLIKIVGVVDETKKKWKHHIAGVCVERCWPLTALSTSTNFSISISLSATTDHNITSKMLKCFFLGTANTDLQLLFHHNNRKRTRGENYYWFHRNWSTGGQFLVALSPSLSLLLLIFCSFARWPLVFSLSCLSLSLFLFPTHSHFRYSVKCLSTVCCCCCCCCCHHQSGTSMAAAAEVFEGESY